MMKFSTVLGLFFLITFFLTYTASSKELKDSIPEKVKKINQKIDKIKESGGDLTAIARVMEKVKELINRRKLREADFILDKLIKKLDIEMHPKDASLAVKKRPNKKNFGNFQKVNIIGEEAKNGIYDPSIEYNADGSVGWLAYTAVYGDMKKHDTHIAKTTDKGKSWHYTKTVNKAYDETIETINGKRIDGFWVYEVASIVYDPDDPGKEWKLFAFKYFSEKNRRRRHPEFSWIVYRTANAPSGEWSEEIALFGAGGKGHAPQVPYNKNLKYKLNDLHQDLKKHVTYSEPGSFYKDGILYLSLSGLSKGGAERIILLSSKDHGLNWNYSGTIIDRKLASTIGEKQFDGSSIVDVNDKIYLITTPTHSPSRTDINTNGAMIFQFESLSNAKLKKDKDGKLILLRHIKPLDLNSGNHGAGQSDYDEFNKYGGIMFSQISLDDDPQKAQIFNTKINL